MAKVLVVGSANTDMVVQTSRFPEPGETLFGGAFHMLPGGKGANQAVAAARMSAPVTFVCALGDDLFGRNALEGYSREGIDTSGVQILKGVASGVALITVNAAGENEIVVAPGANSGLTPAHLEGPLTQISDWGVALTQLETPLEVVAFLSAVMTLNPGDVVLMGTPDGMGTLVAGDHFKGSRAQGQDMPALSQGDRVPFQVEHALAAGELQELEQALGAHERALAVVDVAGGPDDEGAQGGLSPLGWTRRRPTPRSCAAWPPGPAGPPSPNGR